MQQRPSPPNILLPTNLDRSAWEAVCNWPDRSTISTVKNGLNYGILTRYFLWDKVPRAIRYQLNPNQFSLEETLWNQHRAQQLNAPNAPTPPSEQSIQNAFHQLARLTALRLDRLGRSLIFVPRQHAQLRSTIAALQADPSFRFIAPNHPGNTDIRTFQTPPKRSPDIAFTERLYQSILEGLEAFNIDLLLKDRQTLHHQLHQQAALIPQIEAELAAMRPNALLVFSDNHTPSQEYVAIANRQNIPTILLQHGLDCERYCLSDAYASILAVWGPARQQQYQQTSQQQPKQIQVTGNPRYDAQRPPKSLHPSGNQWLWVTRPHGPEKCYLPSRSPQEGLNILTALIAALRQNPSARLAIKPHPFDYIDLYAAEIKKQQMSDRIALTRESLDQQIPKANIVISEDSTAALEAMFFGKILIHAHFAPSPPVLPLVQYSAALPANTPELLQDSLSKATALSAEQANQLFTGQRSFIRDYAGPLDGQATQRVSTLIKRVVTSKNCHPTHSQGPHLKRHD